MIGQLKIDSISCEKIRDYGFYSDLDDESRNIIKTIEKELNFEDEKLVNLFIHRILELKLNFELPRESNGEEVINPMFRDSGKIIKIRNSDSSFLIEYFNIEESANTWYGKIRKEIFGI